MHQLQVELKTDVLPLCYATNATNVAYSECSRFHPYRFTFGRIVPERVNTVKKAGRKVNLIFGCMKPSFEPNNE